MAKRIYNTFNKKEVEDLYVKGNVPLSQIAYRFGVSHKTMKRFFVENNISIHGRVSSNPFLSDIEWLRKQYTMGNGLQKIADISESTRGNVYYALKKANINLRKEGDKNNLYNRIQINRTSGNYKGGRRMGGDKGRYIQVLSHGHPFCDKDGYVMEHRLIMEKKIGRYLRKDEIVHHLNGDGHDNNINNLKLTNKKDHFKEHYEAVKEVIRLKKILDKNNLTY